VAHRRVSCALCQHLVHREGSTQRGGQEHGASSRGLHFEHHSRVVERVRTVPPMQHVDVSRRKVIAYYANSSFYYSNRHNSTLTELYLNKIQRGASVYACWDSARSSSNSRGRSARLSNVTSFQSALRRSSSRGRRGSRI
jgi:hypothetical protein